MKKFALLFCMLAILAIGVAALAENPTLAQAKDIALAKAGVAAEQALFTKAHPDYDDGRQVYEIEFYVGSTEYDFEIDAVTGDIREFSTETHLYGFAGETGSAVSEEQAKQVALAHAGFKAEDVRFIKSKLDRDDGRKEFEIEFIANNMKYEYSVDAATGRITEFDIDND